MNTSQIGKAVFTPLVCMSIMSSVSPDALYNTLSICPDYMEAHCPPVCHPFVMYLSFYPPVLTSR